MVPPRIELRIYGPGGCDIKEHLAGHGKQDVSHNKLSMPRFRAGARKRRPVLVGVARGCYFLNYPALDLVSTESRRLSAASILKKVSKRGFPPFDKTRYRFSRFRSADSAKFLKPLASATVLKQDAEFLTIDIPKVPLY